MMSQAELLERVVATPGVCGGKACIRGTRIPITIILDGLADGMTPDELIDHYPQLSREDIQAALAYAAELSRESIWNVLPAQ
jgi:uncharacterized protein (DUF433 family)